MSFTYDISLTDDISKVRSLIDDTDEDIAEFQDETINAYLTTNKSDIYVTAADLAMIMSVQYLKMADDAEMDDIRLTFKDKAESFMQLYDHFMQVSIKRSKSKGSSPMFFGGISKSQFDTNRDDCSLVKPKFTQDTIFHNKHLTEDDPRIV